MAAPTHVNSDDSSTYELDQSDHAWIFDEGHLFSGTPYSIHQASTFSNDTITVNARVLSTSGGAGIYFQGSDSSVVVSGLGVVSGGFGIYLKGAGMAVENDGAVIAQGFSSAIQVTGANAHIVNNGSLIGVGGISMDSDDGIVENNGHIFGSAAGMHLTGNNLSATLGVDSVITAETTGVWVENFAGEKSTVTNNGLIGMAEHQAFAGAAGMTFSSIMALSAAMSVSATAMTSSTTWMENFPARLTEGPGTTPISSIPPRP
jgi:hypothetical protein